MKGLPHKCCLCDCDIKNKNSILLLCSCLIAICKDCGIKQLSEHVNTYHSYIECPICLNQETNSMNEIIRGVKEAEDYQKESYEQACTHFKLSKKSSKRNKKGYFDDNFTLLKMYRDELSYIIKDYEDYYIDPSDLGVNYKDRMDQLCLLVARLECYRQLQIPKKLPNYVSDLPLGPLSKISFVSNYTLERILLERKPDTGILLRQDQESMGTHCIICSISPLTNMTTLSLCSCIHYCCQICVRNSIANATVIDKAVSNAVFVKCPSCSQKSIRLYDIPGFFLYRDQLINQIFNNLGENKRWTKKDKDARDKLYAFYCKLYKECNYIGSMKKFHDYMPDTYTIGKESEDICLLELSRLEIERRRRVSFHVLPEKKSQALPLGPLNRLTIKPNIFLEAYAALLALGVDDDDDDDDLERLKQYFDSNAKINEASKTLVAPVFNEKGGELSDKQLDDIIAFNRANNEEEITLQHIVRQDSTPCPCCSCNPYCHDYLTKHINNHHQHHLTDREEDSRTCTVYVVEDLASGVMEPAVTSSCLQIKDCIYTEQQYIQRRCDNINRDGMILTDTYNPFYDQVVVEESVTIDDLVVNPSIEVVATTVNPQIRLEGKIDAVVGSDPLSSASIDFFQSNVKNDTVIVDNNINIVYTAERNSSIDVTNHTSVSHSYLNNMLTSSVKATSTNPSPQVCSDEAIERSTCNSISTNPNTTLPNIAGGSRIKKKSSLDTIDYCSDENIIHIRKIGKEKASSRFAVSNETINNNNINNTAIKNRSNNNNQSIVLVSSNNSTSSRKRMNSSRAKDFFQYENLALSTTDDEKGGFIEESSNSVVHSNKESVYQPTKQRKQSVFQPQKPTMSKVDIANMKSRYNNNLNISIPEDLLGYFTMQELQLRNRDVSPDDLISYAPIPSLYHIEDEDIHDSTSILPSATTYATRLDLLTPISSVTATTASTATTHNVPPPLTTTTQPTVVDSKELEEMIYQLELKEEERVETQKGAEYAFVFEINNYNLNQSNSLSPEEQQLINKQTFDLVIKYPKGALRYELNNLTSTSLSSVTKESFSSEDYMEKKISLKCYNWKLLSVQTCLKLVNHRLIGSVKEWRSTKNIYLNCRKDFESYGITSNSTVWLVKLHDLKLFFSKSSFTSVNNANKQMKIPVKEEHNNNANTVIKQEPNNNNNSAIINQELNNNNNNNNKTNNNNNNNNNNNKVVIKQELNNSLSIKEKFNVSNQSSEQNHDSIIYKDTKINNNHHNSNYNNNITINDLKPWDRENFKKKRKYRNKTSLPYTTTTASFNPNSRNRTATTTRITTSSRFNVNKRTTTSSRFNVNTSILDSYNDNTDNEEYDEYSHIAIKVENIVDRRNPIHNKYCTSSVHNNNSINNNSTQATKATDDLQYSHYNATTNVSNAHSLTEPTVTTVEGIAANQTTSIAPVVPASVAPPVAVFTSSRFNNVSINTVLHSNDDDSDDNNRKQKKTTKYNNNITKRKNILSSYSQSKSNCDNRNNSDSRNNIYNSHNYSRNDHSIYSSNHHNDRGYNNKSNNQNYRRLDSKENCTSDSSRFRDPSRYNKTNTTTNKQHSDRIESNIDNVYRRSNTNDSYNQNHYIELNNNPTQYSSNTSSIILHSNNDSNISTDNNNNNNMISWQLDHNPTK